MIKLKFLSVVMSRKISRERKYPSELVPAVTDRYCCETLVCGYHVKDLDVYTNFYPGE